MPPVERSMTTHRDVGRLDFSLFFLFHRCTEIETTCMSRTGGTHTYRKNSTHFKTHVLSGVKGHASILWMWCSAARGVEASPAVRDFTAFVCVCVCVSCPFPTKLLFSPFFLFSLFLSFLIELQAMSLKFEVILFFFWFISMRVAADFSC